MTRIYVDDILRSKLGNLSEPLEFYDQSGRVIGHFEPASKAPRDTEPTLSEEELARIEQEPDYSTAEVLAQLEKI